MNRKHKKDISIKSRLILIMLLCWLVPFALLVGGNVIYLSGDRLDNQIQEELEKLKFSDGNTLRKIENVRELSLKPSYDREIFQTYSRYRDKEINRETMILESSEYLHENYDWKNDIDLAILWYWEDPRGMSCSTRSASSGAMFGDIQKYWKEDHDTAVGLAAKLGTRMGFLLCEDRLYLVRNLCLPNYQPAAALVLRIDQESVFEAYSTFSENVDITLRFNNCNMTIRGNPVPPEKTGQPEMGGSAGYTWNAGTLWLYHNQMTEACNFASYVCIKDDAAFSPFYGYGFLFMGTLLFLIPLMLLLLAVLRKHITKPIDRLMKGAAEIEDGNLGYQLTEEPRNTEFRYLTDSFNVMSERIKYQFNHIYEEELALRDAKIKALQSQINPHFMNNTLEIINWEARMAGNEKVSEMIEALATLMNAGIDRNMLPEIPLSEEMVYVDAYLYIISERFGSRLTILNEIPDEIMSCTVPRLILQPVIENAVEHGVAVKGEGTVMLYGYVSEGFLNLEITNDNVLTREDRLKINKLLDPEYDTSHESSAHLGIANVNQRLRILYGEESGLEVFQADSEHVCSRLHILLREKDLPDGDMLPEEDTPPEENNG